MPVAGIHPGTPDQPADLVVRNAKVYTNDPHRPRATAVAVRDGLISAVGDDADVAALVGPDTRVVDELGRRAVPGLNDAHLHVIRGGLNYVLELRGDGVPTLRQALAMLRVQAERTPPGQWVRVVGGWSADQFVERRLPTLEELNAAAPDTPVFVLHLYQSALLNRAALRAAGFTRATPDPVGGQIVRGHAGEPTGLLIAAPGALLLYSTLAKAPALDEVDRAGSTRHFLRELNRFGLTFAIDAAGGFQSFPENYATVMEPARQGQLTLRIAYHLFPQTAGQELDDLTRWVGTVRPGDGDAWLRLNGAGENLTWAAADFENFTEPRPQLGSCETEFEKAVRLLMENGWGFRLHATYDETTRRDLAVFEKLAADGLFPHGNRWLFDNAETVSPDSLDRIAALGGAVSVQNRLSFQGEAFVARYGVPAAAEAPPLRAMLSRGLTVAAGTDATRVSSCNPWVALHWLVSGRAVSGRRLAADHNRLGREQALELYTLGGARPTGEEAVKGRLKVGSYADLAILGADYFTVPEPDIPHIESVLTVVGGRIVHGAQEHQGLAPDLPAVAPSWSPVTRFGGYHATPAPSLAGVHQAERVAAAAAASDEQRAWREARGLALPGRGSAPLDPCFF
ncbi:amidohydrolase [Kitasatospora sp. NPDC127067]|uniref:amidohydrolase n=1 Tax=Kitasatospora sp. NPDC127067 TaxID=3347126 RepID=UPI00365D3812